MNQQNEIILFENQGVKLEVNMKDETVWLSVKQMAELFDREESNIRRHIINIFKEQELIEANNVQNLHVDGVKQKVPFYNLDVIISVGYRVKSQNGVIFRKWATKVLKDVMIKGYAVNQKRLEYLEKTVKLIDIANRIDEKLDNNDVYQSIEEKASNFLYMIVKNHVFIDGNKRIAATLFIYFLNFYDILYKNGKQVIDNNTLTALTLFIAESNPKEKEVIIDLVMNFLS